MPPEPRRVALVKLSSLGDVVHALPVAAALKARFPGARLTWLVERREAALLRGHPALDDVLVTDTRGWRRVRGAGGLAEVARAVGGLARRLRAARFDAAIDLQGLLKSGVLTALTRAPLRIGFARPTARELNVLFTNRRVAVPAGRHVVEQYLALVRPFGIVDPRPEFTLPADGGAEARIDGFFEAADLKARDRLVVLLPAAARPEKRWPRRRFAAVAARLAADAGARVLVLWGPGEEADARAIVAEAPAAILAPPTDLAELIAVLRRASVAVGADTGPLHVAAALGVACVGLYGPTAAERNGPYGASHRALQSPDGTPAGIDTGAVVSAAAELLA